MTRLLKVMAATMSAALMLTACSSTGLQKNVGAGGGKVTIAIGEPENMPLPGNTTEMNGQQILQSVFTGLIQYHPRSTNAEFSGVASKITTADNTTFKIQLRQDWTFHDGTPVTADSFIDAWNYAALSTNGQKASYFMSSIQGYDDLQAAKGETPRYQEMSGLRKVNDFDFTVTLKSPFAQWPLMTGYSAFFPLPRAFFDNPKEFGKKPIGNGPWKAASELIPGEGMDLVRFEQYAGVNQAKAAELRFQIYGDINTAYQDVMAGNIDVARVPTSALASAKRDFGRRYFERESSVLSYFGFPLYEERFRDKRVRQALSLGINRELIVEAMFNNTMTPASTVVAPQIPGARPGACKYCKYDPQRANQLLDEAGFDRSKPIDIWFNSDNDHLQWVTAVAKSWNKDLGINYQLRGDLKFSTYYKKVGARQMSGPYRLGWGMDYPSMQNYLEPLFSSASLEAGGSNSTYYRNPQFDELVRRGNSALTSEQAIKHYQEAEDVILEDLPIIPLFFGMSQWVHSDRVNDLVVDGFSYPVSTRLQVVQ